MPTDIPYLFLASTSPRRAELLKQLGIGFTVLQPPQAQGWCDERPLPDESPKAYVQRMASEKAEAAWRYLASISHDFEKALILAADTIVVCEGRILGKPQNASEARAMLRLLSGRAHEVFTAICVCRNFQKQSALSSSRVFFAPLPESWIERYVASGEALDKAGAYALQGQAAAYILRIEGSCSGIIGLDLYETARLLAMFGLPLG